ncbi:MAG: isoleucine--tRNA ligase [Oscillospiraceae bacterium]|jgi:isoleucyl-tRNA synthetase|nr:isoleucine--tRNA ligase [Oscillospiraceae bacterium]
MEKNELIRMEHEVLRFWEENDCFGKLREKAAGRPLFRFLDGPITANNPMGIHHAWGRSLKDIYIRYKFRRGFDCRCQNGFDAQGLWVEVGVEKELGFESKRDIERYGLDRFTRKCVERVETFSGIITEQSKRLGQWMDWENSYFTHTDENIQGIWHFLKKCHENGWLRQEHKPMPWCPRCGTSLSEHEMTGSYRQMTHDSVFFQLPVEGKDFRILVWTTTPWTLSSNVALAVNPEIEYCVVKLHNQEAPLLLAKNALKRLGGDKPEIIACCKGEALVGLRYETCFPEFAAQRGISHRIVAWEDVDAGEGTGVVHIAPGCGAEDFQLGLRENLPQVMPVDDLGVFLEGFGFMTGKDSGQIADAVFAQLAQRGKLYKVEAHTHSYPVCWRCKTPVIFRLVPAWYIATEELKPRLLACARQVRWEPESGGRRMEDWLRNMGDWNISRKRYYGLPLPFYPCAHCGELTVAGSKEELIALGGKGAEALPELHRPWIDEIRINCPKCGKPVSRIPDTGDVWLDAGIVPFSTTGYFHDRAAWEKNYPAEWITEMSEQVRLWFYSMLFMSVVLENRPPYERVMCYSAVVREDGGRFSKTGYMIQFDEAAEKIGSDAIRYLYAGNPITSDVRFGYAMGDEARRKLLAFWNIISFFETYAGIDRPALEGFAPDPAQLTAMDRWLLLRSNAFLETATQCMEHYKAYQLVKEFEGFTEDVSNWYIRLNRRRFWKSGDKDDQMAAYYSLYHALKTAVQVMAPILPFMTEDIWQRLVRRTEPGAPLSVHLGDWPSPLADLAEEGVLEQAAQAREVIATALRLRNEAQIKVRQPLQTLFIHCDQVRKAQLLVFERQLLDELNVKALVFLESAEALRVHLPVVNFKLAGAALKARVNDFKAHLAGLAPEALSAVAAQVLAGGAVEVPGWEGAVESSLFLLQSADKPGIVSTAALGGEVAVALDTTLTGALRKEGAARDVIRQIQIMRKDAGYAVEQRIALALLTEGAAAREVVSEFAAHIAAEALAEQVSGQPLPQADLERDATLAGDAVRVQIAACSAPAAAAHSQY